MKQFVLLKLVFNNNDRANYYVKILYQTINDFLFFLRLHIPTYHMYFYQSQS